MAIVGNDPVNGVDPTGMVSIGGCGSRIEGVNNCSGESYFAYEGALQAQRAETANVASEGNSNSQGTPGDGHNGGPPLDDEVSAPKTGKILGFVGRLLGGVGAAIGFVFPESITGGSFDDPSFPDGATESGQNLLNHIFRQDHNLLDTPGNRALLISATRAPTQVYQYPGGTTGYWRTQPNGSEVWVRVRNGIIVNGGINPVPRGPPR